MVRRIPNASGNIRVHDSVMMALSVLLVIAADVVDDDDDDSSWVMFGGGISILRGGDDCCVMCEIRVQYYKFQINFNCFFSARIFSIGDLRRNHTIQLDLQERKPP